MKIELEHDFMDHAQRFRAMVHYPKVINGVSTIADLCVWSAVILDNQDQIEIDKILEDYFSLIGRELKNCVSQHS